MATTVPNTLTKQVEDLQKNKEYEIELKEQIFTSDVSLFD